MRLLYKAASLAAFAVLAAQSAFGQGAVLQSGAITINHCAMWIANGIIADSGATCGSGGSGGVTSVGLTMPNWFSVGNSPITSSGSFNVTILPQVPSTVLAAPVGSQGTPTFRTLQGADLPAPTSASAGGVYSIAATPHEWVSYIDTTGIPYQSQPTFSDIGGTLNSSQLQASGVVAGSYVNANVSVNAQGLVTSASSGGTTGGTVSSVGLTMPTQFVVSGSPVTTSGTLAVGLASESANTVFAGPTSGGAGAPSFRTLMIADLPAITALGTVTSGTWQATPIANAYLANDSITFGAQSPVLGGSATVQGNGGKVQLSTGAVTAGHCAQFDSNGNTVDAGAACGTGGTGSGTVTSGTSGQVTFYASTGTTVAGNGNITASNGAVTFGSSGVVGTLTLTGSSSGGPTIQPGAAAAGTYNFNLPTGAGTSGQLLASGGGSSTAMTWKNVGSIVAGGPGVGCSGTATVTCSVVAPGFLSGCVMSNDGSTPNTVIDTAACIATSSDATTGMSLAAFTKTTGSFVSGSGNGCLDTGTVASGTWYSLFVIEGNSGTDELCSTSASSPTLPSGYTLFRRIGSFRTDGSAHIMTFLQNGNEYLWKGGPVIEQDIVSIGSGSTTYTLGYVPTGVVVNALITGSYANANAPPQEAIWSDPGTSAPSPGQDNAEIVTQVVNQTVGFRETVRTNTSAQVRITTGAASGTLGFSTYGWIDTRGQ